MTLSVDEAVRGLQIIVGGLIAGLIVFTAVMGFVGPLSSTHDPTFTFGLLAGLGMFGMMAAIAYTVVRRKILEELRASAPTLRQVSDPSSLALDAYRRFVIVGGGLIEGPAFFAGIVYLLSGHVLALAVMGLAIALHAARFPSVEKLRAFAEEASQG